MTSSEIAAISDASKEILKKRIHLYISQAAVETLDTGTVDAYLKQYALRSLNGGYNIEEWLYACLANNTIFALADVTAVTDNDLSFVVKTSLFPKFALASA